MTIPISISKTLVLFVALLFIGSSPAIACTVFSISDGLRVVNGGNLDWNEPIPGLILVNKRGIEKSILNWKGILPENENRDSISWKSRYGSVTFTCYGRDFIEGGMNEAGLIIDQASLPSKYPADRGRPGISCQQWIQYQLDNYATTEEVIANLDSLRPDGEGWHYLITDREGRSAVIEYLDGEAVVYDGDSMSYPILTNTAYKEALTHIPLDRAFGGKLDITSRKDSYGRFVRVAELIRDYDHVQEPELLEYAVCMLDEVSVDDTRRSVAYDPWSSCIAWKTDRCPRLKWLSFHCIDLGEGTPVLMIDVDVEAVGDVSGMLIPYNVNTNRRIVEKTLHAINPKSALDREIKERDFSLQGLIDLIARHPGVK